MQNLIELPSPTLTPHSLRKFYDKMETSIRGLESLGQTQETYGSLLIPIIFGKLPDDMRKSMTREHGKRNWDIKSLREAIAKEMYVQESGSTISSDNLIPTASFHTGSMTKSHKSNKSAAENRPKRPCVFCQQSHSPNECTRITANEERLSIIKQKRLCFNCFGNH